MSHQTITSLACGREFHDAIPDGEDFLLRFKCGLEIRCTWDSSGPVVKSYCFGVDDITLHMNKQFHYVSGKIVRYCVTDGRQLSIVFSDGHELRSDFKQAPELVAVDVKVYINKNLLGVVALGN